MNLSGPALVAGTGLFCSGLAAGLTLSYPAIINKLFQPPSSGPIAQRLVIWNKGYEAGKASIPLTAIGAAVSYLVGAYKFPLVGELSQQAAIGAGVLHLGIIPFTLLFIKPVNDILIAHRQRTETKSSEKGSSTPNSGTQVEIDRLLDRWVFLHNCRVAMTCAAFAVGLGNVLGVFV